MPTFAHGGGCQHSAWRWCLLAQGPPGLLLTPPRWQTEPSLEPQSSCHPWRPLSCSTHNQLRAQGWAQTPMAVQGRPLWVLWGSTTPVTPVQLHWAKASWCPWETHCCHLPLDP